MLYIVFSLSCVCVNKNWDIFDWSTEFKVIQLFKITLATSEQILDTKRNTTKEGITGSNEISYIHLNLKKKKVKSCGCMNL